MNAISVENALARALPPNFSLKNSYVEINIRMLSNVGKTSSIRKTLLSIK